VSACAAVAVACAPLIGLDDAEEIAPGSGGSFAGTGGIASGGQAGSLSLAGGAAGEADASGQAGIAGASSGGVAAAGAAGAAGGDAGAAGTGGAGGLPACAVTYGNADGVLSVCLETADRCELAYRSIIRSCTQICHENGGACLAVFNNVDGTACERANLIPCGATHLVDAICICSRGCGAGPPCPSGSRCTDGSCD
jgi:hypothetical protein